MKNIILIDAHTQCVDEILRNDNIIIQVLIVTSEEQRQHYINEQKIMNIYIHSETANFTGTANLNYEIIDQMKDTQHKVENCLDRFILDYQIKKKIYYTALDFWIGVFNKNKIDAVIINGVNHGMPYDGIPYGLGIKRDIPVYTIDVIMVGKRAVCNQLHNRFLTFDKSNNRINLQSSKNYSMTYDVTTSKQWGDAGKIKKGIGSFIYKFFGFLGLEFVDDLVKGSFCSRTEGGNGITYNYFNKLASYRKMKKIERHLKKMECPYKSEEKFIFYALHFEPEGGILARVSMDSHWALIKMIQENLPEGWYIYVKEHPHQFKLNNWTMAYYINNIEYFKSKTFYDEINKLERVKLIDSSVSSKVLLEKAQAVATMNGTIALEATDYNKPVLLFADNTTPLRECLDYFKIRCSADCREAIESIQNGVKPSYDDLDSIMDTYVANADEEGYREIVEIILQNMR